MPAPEGETTTDGIDHHYVDCDYCGRHQNTWSVIVDESGDVVQIECKQCGGTGWERRQEANHV